MGRKRPTATVSSGGDADQNMLHQQRADDMGGSVSRKDTRRVIDE